jgi:rare lipoprotein A
MLRIIAFLLLSCLGGVTPVFAGYLPVEEVGKATFYANTLQGRKTASGEKYDKDALTCAHKSYPFGTRLKVTNLENNKSVIVRVNDRGPFIEGYIVDLSRRAAESVDMISRGVVKVKIERLSAKEADAIEKEAIMKPEMRSTPDKTAADKKAEPEAKSDKKEADTKAEKKETDKKADAAKTVTAKDFKSSDLYRLDIKRPDKKGFGVQVATFGNSANVFKEVAKLQSAWSNKILVAIENGETEETSTYKIIIGPAADRKAADKIKTTLAKKGYPKAFVVDLSQ